MTRRRKSSLTWTRRTTRSTATRRGGFSTATTAGYCYLPLYIFCGEFLLAAKLRPSNIDASFGALEEIERIVAQIRSAWPKVRIILRGDSGFCREPIMAWCEAHGVDFLFGLARNARLEKADRSRNWRRRKRFSSRRDSPRASSRNSSTGPSTVGAGRGG